MKLNRATINRVGYGMAIGAVAAGAMLLAEPEAHATPPPPGVGCETVPWGFLGSQRRTLCDGPIAPDGGWMRARVVAVPAHQVPFTCSYGRYSSSCSGGYFVDTRIVSEELYPVRPETVLPDEPGHIGEAGVTRA
jgi:hypothetical protein